MVIMLINHNQFHIFAKIILFILILKYAAFWIFIYYNFMVLHGSFSHVQLLPLYMEHLLFFIPSYCYLKHLQK